MGLRPNDPRIYHTIGVKAYNLEVDIRKITTYTQITKYFYKISGLEKITTELYEFLIDLQLNLEPAMKRCAWNYGMENCEKVWGVMAVKKCPAGYTRFGCCTCVLPCPSGFYDEGEM